MCVTAKALLPILAAGSACGRVRTSPVDAMNTALSPAITSANAPPGGSVLVLHSCTPVLGVGWRRMQAALPDRIETFDVGRRLANDLLGCLEKVCPAEHWPSLSRLAVAIGPGGFTATRLTVVLARTLAQQLSLPLDGVSSFLLIGRRLGLERSTWLVQDLPRRGVVAGLYAPDPERPGEVVEQRAPRLYPGKADLEAVFSAACESASVALAADVAGLLDLAVQAHQARRPGPWEPVLPLYPTSPVGTV
jgi:tRNA threonylcarbamoyladenosine biosynthesis protein TsaB